MAALQKGDLILITGGCGWVGSHIVEKALEHGLRVRMAVRDQAKADKLIAAVKAAHDGQNVYIETVLVKDMGHKNAYEEAVKGVQGIVHAAAVIHTAELITSFETCVARTMQGYTNILNAANASPNVRRLVLTSSIIVTGMPNPEGKNVEFIGHDTWDTDVIEEAKNTKDHWKAYAACKVLSEQYAWDFVKQHKPKFILNTVLPSMCIGQKVPGTDYSSTGSMLREALLNGKGEVLQYPELWYVDSEDAAMLHILALIQEDVQNERLLANADCCDRVTVVDLARKLLPAGAKLPVLPSTTVCKASVFPDNSRSRELLAPYGGFKSLEYSLKGNLEV